MVLLPFQLMPSNDHREPQDTQPSTRSLTYHVESMHTGSPFFPRTITDWNALPEAVRLKPSVDSFHAALQTHHPPSCY